MDMRRSEAESYFLWYRVKKAINIARFCGLAKDGYP
jgi:hypothetical protein